MLIKAKIIEVEMREHKGKKVADVTFKTSNPTEVHVTTLWSNSVERGDHKLYAEMAGKECEIAVRVEEYNGKINYSFYTIFLPKVVGK